MHVAQFLDALALRPDVEIVKTLLPDMLMRRIEQHGLGGIATPSRLGQNTAGEAQFECLHNGRRILLLRFAD